LPEGEQELFDYLYKFDPKIFREETLKDVARKKDWITAAADPLLGPVERDILILDPFAALAEPSCNEGFN
jgi:hypothetical protein